MCCGFPGYDTGKQLPPETLRSMLRDLFVSRVRAMRGLDRDVIKPKDRHCRTCGRRNVMNEARVIHCPVHLRADHVQEQRK